MQRVQLMVVCVYFACVRRGCKGFAIVNFRHSLAYTQFENGRFVSISLPALYVLIAKE